MTSSRIFLATSYLAIAFTLTPFPSWAQHSEKKPQSVAASAAAKPAIHGLTAMGSTAFNHPGSKRPPDNDMGELFVHPGVYRGAVINTTWRLLEPAQGAYDFSTIETGLRAVAKYNAAHPATPAVAKLRVYSGINVPAWLMPLTGGPFMVTGERESAPISGYWTPAYRKAWRTLQAALAAKYDANPLMGEVASSSCSAMTDESFIYPKNAVSLGPMHAAGFNDEAEKACLLGMADDYAAWKLTPVDETFSPYAASDHPPAVRDDAVVLQVMHRWREVFGERGVLSNHSVQDPLTANLKPIFAELKQMGPPIELQTASQAVITHGKESNGQPGTSRPKDLPPLMDWNNVIQNALDVGAGEIEIWTTVEGGGQAQISYAMLKNWATKLQ